jgi:hypothetical protein
MQKLKVHYDKFLLAAGGAALLLASVYAIFGTFSLQEEFPLPDVPRDGAAVEPAAQLAKLAAEVPHLQDPAIKAWGDAGTALFVSRVYLLGNGELVDIFESDTELVPGIANDWILKYKLDYTDRNLGQADPDNDGFDNSEEFRAGTDPVSSSSKPAAWTKLRLASSKVEKLRTKFESLPTGDLEVVQINTVSAENPSALTGVSKFYRRGDAIVLSETGSDGRQVETDTPLTFKEAKLQRRKNERTNSEEEVPSITLVSAIDGKEIELTQGEVKDSPYSLASLLDTRDGNRTLELRSGQVFELEEGQRYKFIDLSQEAAMIEDLSSGEQHLVPRLESDVNVPSSPDA